MSFQREPDFEPLPGYRLIEPLGSGGFGEVWKCEAPGGLFKAIKFVYGNIHALDEDGARAEQERKALDRVKEVRHPFVISTERIEIVEGEVVIVMELADKSLHDHFLECQAAGLVGIPRDDLLRYLRDTAEALDHMNERHGLQHLDVKPRNLFLVSDRVKVADFGLVKNLERQASGVLGGVTPLYASPETFSGKISGHSDQYSLAIVYQEMLTGQRPFNGRSARQLAQQHMQEAPELRALPEAERPVIARALSKDPKKRFPNCLALVRALYAARTARAAAAASEKEVEGGPNGKKSKSLSETMEDFLLEQGSVDKGAEAAPDYRDSAASIALPQEGEEEPGSVSSDLGMTVAQPQTGALRPTIIIGLGAMGRRALLELRCRFLDRFGDLNKLPILRFLYVDTDGEAVRASHHGAPEVALAPAEAYHLGLQPVGHYRRRQLEQLNDWLPREKLHAIPRSLKTQGSRALGRLAFADHHQRLVSRLRSEIQKASHADALYQAVSQTGLALRDSTPRIYVIAAAGGGGSGMLADLGYALRRLLQQLRHNNSPVSVFLLGGAPDDPATPRAEQANVYATLTELNHFADPVVPFTAQYGADGPRLTDAGPSYDCTYLLTCRHRTPEELRDAVAHLGSYLFHEMTTPLGLRLDHERQLPPEPGRTPFRSFGTYAIWFPRGLLLRLAARQACARLLGEWQAPGGSTQAQAEVEAACARALADPELRPEALARATEEAATALLDATPAAALTTLLASLEEQTMQPVAHDDPGNWSRQAVLRVREWLGTGAQNDAAEWRKGKLHRALGVAAQRVAQTHEERLSQAAWGLMEHPGKRIAAAEAALERFVAACDASIEALGTRNAGLAPLTARAAEQLQIAQTACATTGGGFSFFSGGRVRRALRVFLDHMTAYARQALTEEIALAVQQVFVVLRGRLAERLRDLALCRQRLRHLQETLEMPPELLDEARSGLDRTPPHSPAPTTEAYWETIRETATARFVLPEGHTDLDTAATAFLGRLTPEQWTHLDQAVQDLVLAERGGLHNICMGATDLHRHLAKPLLDHATVALSVHLPITDVAEAAFSAAAAGGRSEVGLGRQVEEFFRQSAPLVQGADAEGKSSYLLVPASDAGNNYGDQAREAVSELQLVRVPGQADLMFCREQGYLSMQDLQAVLKSFRPAYEEAALVPQTSPHARFDIADWIVLDP